MLTAFQYSRLLVADWYYIYSEVKGSLWKLIPPSNLPIHNIPPRAGAKPHDLEVLKHILSIKKVIYSLFASSQNASLYAPHLPQGEAKTALTSLSTAIFDVVARRVNRQDPTAAGFCELCM